MCPPFGWSRCRRRERTSSPRPSSGSCRARPWSGGIAGSNYNYATNANQADVDIIPDSIGSLNANLLILVPAGREEDTVSFLLGPSAVRYVALPSSSFDALNASVTYTRLLGRKQTAPGYNTPGTAWTDLLTIGIDGTSVYEPGLGPEQITIASPSIGWSRSNIGLGNKLCGDKGNEAYCYYLRYLGVAVGSAGRHSEPDRHGRGPCRYGRLASADQESVVVGDGQFAGCFFLGLPRRAAGFGLCRQRQRQLGSKRKAFAWGRREVHAAAVDPVRSRLGSTRFPRCRSTISSIEEVRR